MPHAPERVAVGSLLASIGAEAGGVEIDVDRRQIAREPLDLRLTQG